MSFSVIIIVGLSFSLLLLVKRLSQTGFNYLIEITPIVIIGIITHELFYGWLVNTRYFFNVPFLLRINTPFVFVIGPCVYFLVKSFLNPSLIWKKKYSLHFIPFLLVVIYFIPVYLSSEKEKLVYLNAMYEQLPFDSVLIGGLRRLHQLAYLIWCLIELKNIDFLSIKRKTKQNILFILSAFGLFLLIDIYRYFFKFDLLTANIDMMLLSAMAIYLVYIQLQSPTPIKVKTKPENHLLKSNAEIINRILLKNKPYLNSKFNLDQLAKISGIQKNIVSQTINQELNCNFNELINKFRIEEAIHLLKSEETKHLTIEAIAEKAGFNSVSSFNANFRKLTGNSPKKYRV